jgi:hypothetical protein
MGHPIAPSTPVLMVALMDMNQSSQAGPLPRIKSGHSFWASSRQVQVLIGANQARLWQAGDPPAPPAEPRSTVNGVPGLATGTSNSSH